MAEGTGSESVGGGDPAAGSAAPAPTGGSAPSQAASVPAWLEGVPPDLTGWVGEQGFKSAADVIASQRGLMRMKGVPERELLRLQDKWDENPETAAPIYTRLGRPEKPEGYELPDLPVAEGGPDLIPSFRAKAFELGVSQRAAKGLAEWFAKEDVAFGQQRFAQLEQRDAQQEIALRAEWGGAFEENISAGKRAYASVAKAAGFDTQDIERLQESLGYTKTMKLFAQMGRALGEHQPVGGEPELAFGMTPAAATQKADALTAEQMKMDRMDPRYEQIGNQILKLRHIATGEVQSMTFGRTRG